MASSSVVTKVHSQDSHRTLSVAGYSTAELKLTPACNINKTTMDGKKLSFHLLCLFFYFLSCVQKSWS